MLNIKEFKKGQKAYMVTDNHSSEHKILEVTVKTVGRKYVTIDNFMESKYQECDNEYLVEVVHCGWSNILFPTKQDAMNYVEKKDLSLSIKGKVSYCPNLAAKYSLEQLRQINEILEHPANVEEA